MPTGRHTVDQHPSSLDTGTGLDQQGMERLFEAFFATKPNGMNMGLSISCSIVEAHKGRLWAAENEGPGATFHFTLPVHHATAA